MHLTLSTNLYCFFLACNASSVIHLMSNVMIAHHQSGSHPETTWRSANRPSKCRTSAHQHSTLSRFLHWTECPPSVPTLQSSAKSDSTQHQRCPLKCWASSWSRRPRTVWHCTGNVPYNHPQKSPATKFKSYPEMENLLRSHQSCCQMLKMIPPTWLSQS